MRVLAFADYYLPGFQAGGPIRALSNLVDTFEGEIHFDIVTRDRDLGGEAYPGIPRNTWVPVGPARVRYIGAGRLPIAEVRQLLRGDHYDAVYLNSFFSPLSRTVMLVQRFLEGRKLPLIVAPRGEFSPEALRLKGRRKELYLWLIKNLSVLAGITWQASSDHEAEDILRALEGSVAANAVVVTKELVGRTDFQPRQQRQPKQPGHANLAFLSRISPMKNLKGAIDVLSGVKGGVSFDIYGPVDDAGYWAECERSARGLPPNVRMEYKGPVAHEQVASILHQHDLFFLPTRGENYGHVIVEALLAGCPVLISDRTHWRDLEAKGLGWDLPLEDTNAFRRVVERVVAMQEPEHQILRTCAVRYAETIARDTQVIDQNRSMFLTAARAGSGSYTVAAREQS